MGQKAFMAAGHQYNMPWAGFDIFPGELRGSPQQGNLAAAAQRGR